MRAFVLGIVSILIAACGSSGSAGTASSGAGGATASTSHAASSGAGGGSGADPFVGTYTCLEDVTLDYLDWGMQPTTTTTVMLTANFVDDGNGTGTATVMFTGGGSCTLKYSVAGDTATLMSGQSCLFALGVGAEPASITATYTSGTSTLSGNMATQAYSFTWWGWIPVQTIHGTGTASETCTKH
jgi:hypothetical protein